MLCRSAIPLVAAPGLPARGVGDERAAGGCDGGLAAGDVDDGPWCVCHSSTVRFPVGPGRL